MGFRVKNAQKAFDYAKSRGAEPVDIASNYMELRLPAIRGIGGALLYLVDRYKDDLSIYDIDFEYIEGVDRNPIGAGFKVIDHLTHNVYQGRMDYWAAYYEKLFNFREIRFFDIKGEYTGQYLIEYKGEGIQHIAFSCDDLPAAWDKLAELNTPFMTSPPKTYYEDLDTRLPGHGEDVTALQKRGILLDGSTENNDPRLLLQIFSEKLIGPVFFEFIQRKKDEGFGEGNFKALFESIERDQINRGVLKEKTAAE